MRSLTARFNEDFSLTTWFCALIQTIKNQIHLRRLQAKEVGGKVEDVGGFELEGGKGGVPCRCETRAMAERVVREEGRGEGQGGEWGGGQK